MRLAAFTDYGLRVLMRLAAAPAEPSTTARLAEEFRIPYNHLAKVVQDLARGGFIATQRGTGGGIRLARPADSITLGKWFDSSSSATRSWNASATMAAIARSRRAVA